jgi:crotonobetainyl-CoA:carnitine CoA-transferase CaiB-like acyl-CoA transferase
MNPKHMLDGIKVLDFTQFLAGPAATRLMAEMGAEIVKIEEATVGDNSRYFPYKAPDGRSAYYVQQNRGKKSVGIDLKSKEGKDIIRKMIPQFDVLIENFSAGVIGRLGFSWEEVQKLNPKMIMCSISTFGQTGPLSHLPGYDYIAQAYSGVTAMVGSADGPPSLVGLAFGDVSTGVHAATAIGYALFHRERTGNGQYLDIALLDTYFHHHEVNVQDYSASKGKSLPRRLGTHHNVIAPGGMFKGRDRYFFIIALTHQWQPFCHAIGKPELIEDPRFKETDIRIENRFELAKIIEAWMAEQESDDAVQKILEDNRIPVAPILEVEEAMAHPHLIQRETVRTITDRSIGEFQVPGMPLKFSEFPGHLPLVAPYLGEQNAEVLSEYLSMSVEDVAKLEEEGILGTEPVPE